MGSDLKKTFFAFESLVDPAGLVDWKETSNQWEIDYQQSKPTSRAAATQP